MLHVRRSLRAVLTCALSHGEVRASAVRMRWCEPVPLADVHWTDGFWANRFAVNRERSIPAMWEIMQGTEYKPFLVHFLIAAGDVRGRLPRRPVERRRLLQVSRRRDRDVCRHARSASCWRFSTSRSTRSAGPSGPTATSTRRC